MKDSRAEAQQRQNKRTAWILASVVLVFFGGILVRKIFEPGILSLFQ